MVNMTLIGEPNLDSEVLSILDGDTIFWVSLQAGNSCNQHMGTWKLYQWFYCKRSGILCRMKLLSLSSSCSCSMWIWVCEPELFQVATWAVLWNIRRNCTGKGMPDGATLARCGFCPVSFWVNKSVWVWTFSRAHQGPLVDVAGYIVTSCPTGPCITLSCYQGMSPEPLMLCHNRKTLRMRSGTMSLHHVWILRKLPTATAGTKYKWGRGDPKWLKSF